MPSCLITFHNYEVLIFEINLFLSSLENIEFMNCYAFKQGGSILLSDSILVIINTSILDDITQIICFSL